MPEHERQPFADLAAEVARFIRWRPRRLTTANREGRDRRDDEADRVYRDGVGRTERTDEHAAEARPGDLTEGLARAELGVASTSSSRATSAGRKLW
jgi:hypothetical protein